jgi:hypothetical protein
MVLVSCFYCHYNSEPINFTFIQFENYVKVCLNKRAVILTNMQLVLNATLFQYFKLSLLCTHDVSSTYVEKVYCEDKGIIDIYGTYTVRYWKNISFTKDYYFIEFEKSNWKSSRNPLNAKEPKRSSSNKKIKKFMKLFTSFSRKIKDPNQLIREYLAMYQFEELIEYFRRYIEYNRNNPRITILSQILHTYGHDVYKAVNNFM